jgi:hypothetical protein
MNDHQMKTPAQLRDHLQMHQKMRLHTHDQTTKEVLQNASPDPHA